MKKNTLSAAVILALGITTEVSAETLTTFSFSNSTTAGVQGIDFNYACNTSNFIAGREVRMCDPTGALGGGLPDQKDTITGAEQWMFSGDSTTGVMSGVANTASTGGLNATITSYIDLGYVSPSADRDGGLGLDQGASFFGGTFSFLAPYVGSEANTAGSPHPNDIALDPGVYTATSASTFTIFFPVIEAQWNGTHFGLGTASGGVTFQGTTDGTNFSMWAEELIDIAENYGSACCVSWAVQWYYTGTLGQTVVDTFVPVPASFWLFGSGLITLLSRYRKKTI